MKSYDVIVCGLGAMGSAAAWQLACRGRRVLGLDRFEPPHRQGSSHGGTRIIREAYFEHPLYVPLVQRAAEIWEEIGERTGRSLTRRTGGLMLGPADGPVAGGAHRSAERHGLPFEVLSADEVRRRFPAFRPADDDVGIFEPRAGLLRPEACIEAQLGLAREAGAELRFGEPVARWVPEAGGVAVTTLAGTYRADRLVLAAGAWSAALLPDLALPLTVERVVVYWFEPRARPETFRPDRMPVWVHEYEPGRMLYGIPDIGDGAKVGLHHDGRPSDPETIDRDVGTTELDAMRDLLRRHLPDADGRLRRAEVCMYTNSPDEHFVIDAHPDLPQVWIAAGFSGHGFKFSSVVGELVADAVVDGRVPASIRPFRLDRF